MLHYTQYYLFDSFPNPHLLFGMELAYIYITDCFDYTKQHKFLFQETAERNTAIII